MGARPMLYDVQIRRVLTCRLLASCTRQWLPQTGGSLAVRCSSWDHTWATGGPGFLSIYAWAPV